MPKGRGGDSRVPGRSRDYHVEARALTSMGSNRPNRLAACRGAATSLDAVVAAAPSGRSQWWAGTQGVAGAVAILSGWHHRGASVPRCPGFVGATVQVTDGEAVTSRSGRCREHLTRVPRQSLVALALQPGIPRTSAPCREGSDPQGVRCRGETDPFQGSQLNSWNQSPVFDRGRGCGCGWWQCAAGSLLLESGDLKGAGHVGVSMVFSKEFSSVQRPDIF